MEKVEAGKERIMMEKDVQTRSKRTCAVCGKPLPPGRPRYCSDACEKAFRQQREKSRTGKKPRKAPFKILTCPVCGKVEERPIKSKLCAACQKEKDKRDRKACMERKRAGKARTLGNSYPCEACGKLYILCSGKLRYCPDCAEKEVSANIKMAALQRYEAAKDADPDFLQKRRARRPEADPEWRTCVVCGSPFLRNEAFKLYCSPECQQKGTKAQSRESDKARGATKAKEVEPDGNDS